MPAESPDAPTDGALYIDGVPYTVDDLTFAEQDELEKLVKELVPDRPCKACDAKGVVFTPTAEGQPAAAQVCPVCGGEGSHRESPAARDWAVATITIIRRRSDPEFSVEQAKAAKPGELGPPPVAAKTAAKKS